MTTQVQPLDMNFSYAQNIAKKRQDVLDVTTNLFSEKPNDVFKAVYVGIDFGKVCGWVPDNDKTVNQIRDEAKAIKLALAPRSFMKKFNELREAADKFWQYQTSDAAAVDVFIKANSCIGPIYDATEFSTHALRWFPKEVSWFQTFTGVNGLSLTIGSAYNVWTDLTKAAASDLTKPITEVQRKAEQEELTATLFDLIRDVSYLALGILTVLTVFFAFVFSPSTFVILSASTVAFTILNHYYKNLGTVPAKS